MPVISNHNDMIKDDSFAGGNVEDLQQRIRLIDAKLKPLGMMTLSDAQTIARSQGMKLVKITSNVVPPVYRLRKLAVMGR